MAIDLDPDKLRKAILPWISPAEEYVPVMFRCIGDGSHYYVYPWIVSRAQASANNWITWLAWGKGYGYGTYEWKAKAENPVANAHIYLGIFERHHGWASEGGIFLLWDGTQWKFRTYAIGDPTPEDTVITGITFTDENTFKIIWTESYVKLYINGDLKATHTTKVPNEDMQLFAEAGTLGSAPASEPACYFRAGSFKEL